MKYLILLVFIVGCNIENNKFIGKITNSSCSSHVSGGFLSSASSTQCCRVELDNGQRLTLLGPVMEGDKVCADYLNGDMTNVYLCN